MTAKKKNGHSTRSTRLDLSKAPPDLARLIRHFGNAAEVARRLDVGKFAIRDLARGKTKTMTPEIAEAIARELAALPDDAGLGPDLPPIVTATLAPKSYAPWDGSRGPFKARDKNGKIRTIKLPTPMLQLIERHEGVKVKAANAIGYSGWSSLEAIAAKDEAYTNKLHNRIMAALAGDPVPPKNGNSGGPEVDEYRLGMAICLVPLANYDRLDEMAAILDGRRVFRKVFKTNALIVFHFGVSHRDKTEKFKRLAKRDADITCP